jgi:hypothetical protein
LIYEGLRRVPVNTARGRSNRKLSILQLRVNDLKHDEIACSGIKLTFGDVDGDGIPDFIVGKRYFSHLDTNIDPDPRDSPVLYWYKTVRNPKAPGGAELVCSGSDVLAVDLNQDGALDIVTATRFGTFIYWGKPHSAKESEKHARAAIINRRTRIG